MSAIIWDSEEDKTYSTGVEKVTLALGKLPLDITDTDDDTVGALNAVAWNGVTSISDTPSGAEATNLYADNIKWMTMLSREEQGSTIEAYMFPDAWEACDGYTSLGAGIKFGQQKRSKFCLSYQTKTIDDSGNEHNILHILYNGLAAPAEETDNTINDSPEANTFSWENTHAPVKVSSDYGVGITDYCNIEIDLDSDLIDSDQKEAIEGLLYGTTNSDPKIPTLARLVALLTV